MNKFFTNLGKFLVKHAPEILTTVAIGGTITTAVLSAKATPAAVNAVNNALEETAKKKMVPVKQLSFTDKAITTVKAGAKYYILPAASAGITIAAFVSSNHICKKRAAIAAAATAVAQEALSAYEDKMQEVLGVKSVKKLEEAIDKDKIEKRVPSDVKKEDDTIVPFDGPYTDKTLVPVVHTGHGNVLFMDGLTGRYFRSSMEKIGDAINAINAGLIYDLGDGADAEYPVNDYFENLGLDRVPYFDNQMFMLYENDPKHGQITYETNSFVTATGEAATIIDFKRHSRPHVSRWGY